MDLAKDLAEKGCPSMTVVIAEAQSMGRGRLNRQWRSSAGGLYFTLVIRPDLPPEACGRMNFLASVVLTRVLRRRYGIPAMVKWPNDILVAEQKLSGMLSEMNATAGRLSHVAIGIGINVNNDPPSVNPPAISLKRLLNRRVPRQPLLRDFLDDFEIAMNQADHQEIMAQWKASAITMNRAVTIRTTREKIQGTAVDVDMDGALVLRLADGRMKRVVYGDCFL